MVAANLASLQLDEAVLLPGMQESAGRCVKFKLLPRLTSHVRHKAKYLDMQLLVDQGFWFAESAAAEAGPARSLKEFLDRLPGIPHAVLAGHAYRGDFSRWIADVFHDHALASDIRKLEQRFRLGHLRGLAESIAKLVEERYQFSPAGIVEAPARSASYVNVLAPAVSTRSAVKGAGIPLLTL